MPDKKEAQRKAYLTYYYAHREQINERRRNYNAAHREERREYNRKYYATHRDKVRGWKRRKQYGVTEKEHQQLLIDQKGVCAICGSNRSKKDLGVDHDHIDGNVRGLLCSQCNAGLGNFADNPEWLRKAADYIDKR